MDSSNYWNFGFVPGEIDSSSLCYLTVPVVIFCLQSPALQLMNSMILFTNTIPSVKATINKIFHSAATVLTMQNRGQTFRGLC